MTDQDTPGPLLLAYDGSEPADAAVDAAASLMAGAPVVVVTLWRSTTQAAPAAELALPPEVVRGGVEALDAAAEEAARDLAEQGAARAGQAGLDAEPTTAVADPNVWSGIVRMAEERAARAVVMGSRGLSRLKSALLGSVSMAVLQQATCPVLVVSAQTPLLASEAPGRVFGRAHRSARRGAKSFPDRVPPMGDDRCG